MRSVETELLGFVLLGLSSRGFVVSEDSLNLLSLQTLEKILRLFVDRGRPLVELESLSRHFDSLIRDLIRLLSVVENSGVIAVSLFSSSTSSFRLSCLYCLDCLSAFPYALLFPHRYAVSSALAAAVDDSKREVRKVAVKVRNHFIHALTQ